MPAVLDRAGKWKEGPKWYQNDEKYEKFLLDCYHDLERLQDKYVKYQYDTQRLDGVLSFRMQKTKNIQTTVE